MVFQDTVQAPIWTALSDPKRRKIIALLQERPHTTGEICAHFEVSRFAVMKHLAILEKAGLISVRREGRRRWNSLTADAALLLPGEFLAPPSPQAHPIEMFAGRVELALALAAPPVAVFAAFATHIDAWWPERTTADAHIELEAWVNGRFYERFGDDGSGTLFAAVVALRPPHLLRLQGPLGISDRVTVSQVDLSFEPQTGGTRLKLLHHVAGDVDEPLLRQQNDLWRARLDRSLRRFVEGTAPDAR